MDLLEHRGLQIRGEHAALIFGMLDDKVKVTNTAQVRIEETWIAGGVVLRDKRGRSR